MIGLSEKYQKILDELIAKSFPVLRKKNFRAFEFATAIVPLYGCYVPYFNFIILNKKYHFGDKEAKGIIAHELCHAEYSEKYGFLKTLFIWTIYWLNKEIRRKEEMKTERLTIRKGYARELVLSSKRAEKEYPYSKNLTYLSVDGVKSYARSIRKW